jgi:hypothetical protein
MMRSKFDDLTQGTEWRLCAFQVNPYSYTEVHHKTPEYPDEPTYNKAMIASLVANNVSVIAITDHWCVNSSVTLRADAEFAGITVFSGFEATTKDGVHLLVLFDPSVSVDDINRRIGECGIPATCRESIPGRLDTVELLEAAEQWGAVTIAPHVTTGGGLLDKLSGQTAVEAWTHPRLHAVAAGGVAPGQAHRAILENKDSAYKRSNPIALLRAADISGPSDVEKAGSSCWVKLSSMTISGLDLAFRTPETRVAQADPTSFTHPRVVGISWQGGFLSDVDIRFNQSLNVLIGGRGSGKSTVIESLRYVLGILPLVQTLKTEHDAMIKNVLGSGTKIYVEIEVRTPAVATYTIERLIGGQPIVRDSTGRTLKSAPSDVLAGTEIYGQRELADLARDKKRLTELLSRYLPQDVEAQLVPLQYRELADSRRDLLALHDEIVLLDRKIERIAIVKERLKKFDEAGVAEKLDEQARAQKELQKLDQSKKALADKALEVAPQLVELDFLSSAEIEDLPRLDLLVDAKASLERYNAVVRDSYVTIAAARTDGIRELEAIASSWESATEATRSGLEKVLRELQPNGIDGGEFLRLRKELSELEPLEKTRNDKAEELERLGIERERILADLELLQAEQLRALQREAKKVGKLLPGIVKANVVAGEDRAAVGKLLAEKIGGRFDTVRNAIEAANTFTPRDFAATCRKGELAIRAQYPLISVGQSRELAAMPFDVSMLLEELDLPVTTDLQLNLGTSTEAIWRSLDHLSTGQKATALLLLLMHRGTGPLIIDQPEDDLDNRFIYENVVPRLRVKGHRQIIFSSHNANIPVLGDADQIVALAAADTPSGVVGGIVSDGLGSIDHPPVRGMVEEILEGGREAFNTRRYLYGF